MQVLLGRHDANRISRRSVGTLTAYTVAAGVATVTGAAHRRRAAAWTKPLPLMILAADAAAGRKGRSRTEYLLLAGALAFSAAGDRAMFCEEFADDPDRRDRHLAIGASLFAGAQGCYIASLRRRGARLALRHALPRNVLLGESAFLVARRRPALLAVLGPYGSSLATMSALAADAASPQPAMRIGGWLFLLSDLTIINRRYLITDPAARVATEAWVLASYFAAQWLLITGLDGGRDRSAR